MSSDNTKYDIIFAGGGTTACVTASRLAQADPSLKILIVEAGPHTEDILDNTQPARYFRNLVTPAETFSLHESKPSKALGGRTTIVPAGRCIGGGSSVNFAMFTRASASDYDDWEKLYNNPGWGSKELIALLKKAETYQAPGDAAIHGTSGPIKVSYTPDQNNIGTQFLDVTKAYDPERKQTDDTTDFFECDAYGRWPLYVDATTGKRSDVPHNYIYGQPGLENLTIIPRRRVVRVIFENNRAVGIEHVHDVDKGGKSTLTYASRLVVLSSGAFGSPAILERSGIGAADVLKRNNIKQLVDLPGVGENYMDHNVLFTPFHAAEDSDTLDVLFRGPEAELEPFTSQWLKNGQGLMSHNALDAGIRIRPNAADLKLMPEFETRWKTYFANSPDKPIMWIGTLASYCGKNPNAGRSKYFSTVYFTGYPVSSGYVHIQSGPNSYAPLEFHPGYLDESADVGVLRWAYKKAREIARRMEGYRGEWADEHPAYPAGSPAAAKRANGPVPISAPDLVYSAEDDKAIDAFHRKNVATSWHSCGTCGMKPREKRGVVDSSLNVYGVEGLKVADCSIAPANVGANTYNTALAIGEKAAVIIARELGIKGVTEA